MIEAQGLTRNYGRFTAVQGVSFQIGEHEVVGLLGHNGAGKTTVMRMLSGFLEPSAGRILVDGEDMSTAAPLLQKNLGYLPENLPIYPELLVADFLDYAATLKGIAAGKRAQAVREVILATELQQCALAPIHTLSRGYRQRVGVAQAILGRPRLLILDEPTNGLDPQQTAHMRNLIKQLARRATIILSTHIMQEVEAVCDRALILHNGQLQLDQTLAELRRSTQLLLSTDQPAQDLAKNLLRMPQVTAVEQREEGDRRLYTLTLSDGADPETAAGNVARCTFESGARLYRLQPLSRDLSSLFREVNNHGQ